MEIKNVVIDIIPHDQQRYNTVGDWYFEQVGNGSLVIHVSETGNWKWNMCIALHELVEAIACTADGVTQEEVDKFDMSWKPNHSYEEPGVDPRSPYYQQHGLAFTNEQTLFFGMCVDFNTQNDEWNEDESKVEELTKSRE